jgi:hypothetical protein
MDDQRAFLIEEYKSLREEVKAYLEFGRTEERYAVVSCGLLWAFLISHHLTSGLLWAVPIVLILTLIFIRYRTSAHITYLGRYLKDVEKQFEVKGWEHFEREKWRWPGNRIIAFLFLAVTIAAWYLRSNLVK